MPKNNALNDKAYQIVIIPTHVSFSRVLRCALGGLSDFCYLHEKSTPGSEYDKAAIKLKLI